jgi:hypothetical protein
LNTVEKLKDFKSLVHCSHSYSEFPSNIYEGLNIKENEKSYEDQEQNCDNVSNTSQNKVKTENSNVHSLITRSISRTKSKPMNTCHSKNLSMVNSLEKNTIDSDAGNYNEENEYNKFNYTKNCSIPNFALPFLLLFRKNPIFPLFLSYLSNDVVSFARSLSFRMPSLWPAVFKNPFSHSATVAMNEFSDVAFPYPLLNLTNSSISQEQGKANISSKMLSINKENLSSNEENSEADLKEHFFSPRSLLLFALSMESHVPNFEKTSPCTYSDISIHFLSSIAEVFPSFMKNKFVPVLHSCILRLDSQPFGEYNGYNSLTASSICASATVLLSRVLADFVENSLASAKQSVHFSYSFHQLTEGKVNISSEDIKNHKLKTLLSSLPTAVGMPLWDYELPLPDYPPPSEINVSIFVNIILEILSESIDQSTFVNLSNLRDYWAEYSLNYAFCTRDIHDSARSHHIFRTLVKKGSINLCHALLIEILRCLSFPTFDNLSLATEAMVSLNAVISCTPVCLLVTYPELLWSIVAILRCDFVHTFFWGCCLLNKYLSIISPYLSESYVNQFFFFFFLNV